MFSEGNAAHSVGCDCPLLIEMAFGALFKISLNLLGRVWQPLLTIMAVWWASNLKKVQQTAINICSRLSHPTNHSEE
jgi:hypothetical protein